MMIIPIDNFPLEFLQEVNVGVFNSRTRILSSLTKNQKQSKSNFLIQTATLGLSPISINNSKEQPLVFG